MSEFSVSDRLKRPRTTPGERSRHIPRPLSLLRMAAGISAPPLTPDGILEQVRLERHHSQQRQQRPRVTLRWMRVGMPNNGRDNPRCHPPRLHKNMNRLSSYTC